MGCVSVAFLMMITSVHIQVPAYFDEDQREATIQAGRLAGLDTVKLIRWGNFTRVATCTPLT